MSASNVEAPGEVGAGRALGEVQRRTVDFAPCAAFDQPSPEKLRANVQARAALIGIAVHELADGSVLACWRGCSRTCSDWGEVQHLVRQLGGAA